MQCGDGLPLFGRCLVGVFPQKLFQTAGDDGGAGECVLIGIKVGAPQQGRFDRDKHAPGSAADSGPPALGAGLLAKASGGAPERFIPAPFAAAATWAAPLPYKADVSDHR